MKRLIALSIAAVSVVPAFSACIGTGDPGETEWRDLETGDLGQSRDALSVWSHLASQRLGGPGGVPLARAAVDGAGNIVLAGTFSGSITVGAGATTLTSAGGTDIFVIKMSPLGAVQWAVRFGGPGDENAVGVAADGAGNVVFVGQKTDDVDFGGGPVAGMGYIVKLNGCGTHVWSKGFTPHFTMPSSWTHPYSVAANPAGTIVFGGLQNGRIDYGNGAVLDTGEDNMGPFVQVLAPDGSVVWGSGGTTAAVHDPELVRAVAIDAQGNVAVVGEHRLGLTLGACNSNATLPYLDMFVMRFGPGGSCAWSKAFGATDGQIYDSGHDVAFAGNGHVIASGTIGAGVIGSTPVTGSFAVSIAPAGSIAWVRPFPSSGAPLLAADSAGNVLTSIATSPGVVFSRYSPANQLLWSAAFSAAPVDVAAAPNGDAIFTGTFSGAKSFGGPVIGSAGAANAYVVRYGLATVEYEP
jgi:hypothetical protein